MRARFPGLQSLGAAIKAVGYSGKFGDESRCSSSGDGRLPQPFWLHLLYACTRPRPRNPIHPLKKF